MTSLFPTCHWASRSEDLRQNNLSWAGKLKSLSGFGARVLRAFQTDQMQSSYQALDVFSTVSRSPRGNVPAMAIPWQMQDCFSRGPGPLLSTWQPLAEPKLISSAIQSMEKYRGCLRELPGKTIHSLLPSLAAHLTAQTRSYPPTHTGHLCSDPPENITLETKKQYLRMKRNR